MQKFSKTKIAAIFAGAFFLSMPSPSAESLAFRFTAPTDKLLEISVQYLSKKFAPSKEEKRFVQIAKLP